MLMALMFNDSNFSDVFDEEHFIHSLSSDVKIIKKLPKELKGTTKAIMQFRSWSGVEYYQYEISRLWGDYQVLNFVRESICYLSFTVHCRLIIGGIPDANAFLNRLFLLLSLILVLPTTIFLLTFKSFVVVLSIKHFDLLPKLRHWEK